MTGPNDDMRIIRGVNVYPSQIETVLVGRPSLSPRHQLMLDRHGALDSGTACDWRWKPPSAWHPPTVHGLAATPRTTSSGSSA